MRRFTGLWFAFVLVLALVELRLGPPRPTAIGPTATASGVVTLELGGRAAEAAGFSDYTEKMWMRWLTKRGKDAAAAPILIPVTWCDEALSAAHTHALRLQEPLVALIEQCLAQDPRPAYQQPTPERRYGTRLWDLDVRWHYPQPGQICVLDVQLA